MNKKFRIKNNLDELQEQKLLHIEKNGFWLLYVLLAAEIVIKAAVFQSPKSAGGEMLCFFAASIYVVAACIRQGLWDRHLKADVKTNLLVSIAGAAAVLCINGIFAWMQSEKWQYTLVFAGISGAVTFAVCFAAMNILSGIYKRRLKKLEETEEENDD